MLQARDDRSTARLAPAVSISGSPHLYLALTDVHRTIPLKSADIDLSISETIAVRDRPRSEFARSAGGRGVSDPPPRLPVTAAGAFSLDLLYGGEILGSGIVVTEETLPG
jgi:hypothetical protein